jgi:hypothetical protein
MELGSMRGNCMRGKQPCLLPFTGDPVQQHAMSCMRRD